MIKEYRRKKLEQEQAFETKEDIIESFVLEFRRADELEQNYHYKEANDILSRLKNKTQDDETKIEILEHLAHNCEKLNNFEHALDYFSQISNLHLSRGDYEKYFRTILEIAVLYKNLYRFSNAKEEYLKIVNTDKPVANEIISSAYS